MELFDDVYNEISDTEVTEIWHSIKNELETKKFISREDLSEMFETAKAKIIERFGSDVFENPFIYWNIPVGHARVVTLPRVGFSYIEGGKTDAIIGLEFPNGNVKFHVTYKGFV